MKTWKMVLLVGGLSAIAVFAAAAIAFGGAGSRTPFMSQGVSMMAVADQDAPPSQAWEGCGASGLMQDPEAREEISELRAEHREEMRAWWDSYGDDPSGEAAQKALGQLRKEHLEDMRALFEKYGVEPPADFGDGGRGGCGPGAGAVSGPGSGGCGGQGLQGGQGLGMMGGAGAWSGGTL